MLVATVVQFLIPLPLLRGRRTAWPSGWGSATRDVRRILRLMLPVSLGLGLINFNLTLDTVIAAHAQRHGPAYLNYAFRLFMLPQGLFSVAVSTVLFPEISRRAAQRDLPGLGRMVPDGSRTIIFLLLPAAAVSIVLARADRAPALPARQFTRRRHRARGLDAGRVLAGPGRQRPRRCC